MPDQATPRSVRMEAPVRKRESGICPGLQWHRGHDKHYRAGRLSINAGCTSENRSTPGSVFFVDVVMLPEPPAEHVMQVLPDAVIPGAQR